MSRSGLDRRSFLKTGVGAIGALLFPAGIKSAMSAVVLLDELPTDLPRSQGREINDFISVTRQGKIIIGVSQCEVGQGIYTGLAQVVASEMDADWADVEIRFVTGRDAYRQAANGETKAQFIAASTSMVNFYQPMRMAGAQAREIFALAGAKYFGVERDRCKTENSMVVNLDNETTIHYCDLLGYAANITLEEEPIFKERDSKTLEGQAIKRVDTPSKVDGSALYGIDVDVPDMAIGVPWMVPPLGGKLIRIRNEVDVRSMPGVIDLVITRQWSMLDMQRLDDAVSPNTVLVLADSYWQAKKAADALDVEYEAGSSKGITNASIDAINEARLMRDDLGIARKDGDARAIISAARKSTRFHEARYSIPYHAHATMEPCTSTCMVSDNKIEVWGAIQGQDLVRQMLGEMFSVAPENVIVHTMYSGGSLGRKYVPDAAMHAATASKAIGRPVKIIYPRDVDLAHEYYRPSELGQFEAVLDATGYPKALSARTSGQSLFWQLYRARVESGNFDETMVECIYTTIYDIPDILVESGFDDQPVPVGFLRGAGSVANVFFLESFINELAEKAGIDEYLYRKKLLARQPLALKVIEATAKCAKWDVPAGRNTYRGFAFNNWVGRDEAFTSPVAIVVDVTRSFGRLKITKIYCAIDCGHAVNPNLIRANIEGGIGYALTSALKSEVHFEDGAVVETNFDRYPLLKIAEMPEIEVEILKSERPPQGVSEVATAAVAPALASALHKATGNYYRIMPIKDPEFG